MHCTHFFLHNMIAIVTVAYLSVLLPWQHHFGIVCHKCRLFFNCTTNSVTIIRDCLHDTPGSTIAPTPTTMAITVTTSIAATISTIKTEQRTRQQKKPLTSLSAQTLSIKRDSLPQTRKEDIICFKSEKYLSSIMTH